MLVRDFGKNVVRDVDIEAAKYKIGKTAVGCKINCGRDLVTKRKNAAKAPLNVSIWVKAQ